jgi:hypothetical protein
VGVLNREQRRWITVIVRPGTSAQLDLASLTKQIAKENPHLSAEPDAEET